MPDNLLPAMMGVHPPAKYLNGISCVYSNFCVKPNLQMSDYVTQKGRGNTKTGLQPKINRLGIFC